MPRTSFDDVPEVDELKALILERKLAYKLSWEDIATKAKVISPTVLRKLVSTKRTEEWSPAYRTAVCRALGISQKNIFQVETLK